MRNNPNLRAERYRVDGPVNTSLGAFIIERRGEWMRVIASNGGGWDHVSVSLRNRCPNWEEMDFVKNIFFKEDELAVQFHVPAADHINCHPFCLHLWRPQSQAEILEVKAEWDRAGQEYPYELNSPGQIPLPPAWMVGPAGPRAA